MRGISSRSGLTIVELLIAGFILTVILGIVGTYLGEQSRINRANLVASEVQDKTRLVMQLVVQDLQLGGAKTYADNAGQVSSESSARISSCPSDGSQDTCLVATNGNEQDSFSTVYINSLRTPAEACREVGYRFDGNMLQRADRSCAGSTDLLDPSTDAAAYSDLAPNILALDVEYKCSDSATMVSYPDNANCPLRAAYLRSAVVTVVGRSNNRLENRASETFTTVSNQTVTCPQHFRCFSIQQEVLMPNFKDR